MEPSHNLDIQGLERVASWLDKVHACVNTVVHNVDAVNLVLGIEIGVKALLDVVGNRAPRFIVVNEITETWSINDSQSEAHAVLLNVGRDGLNSNSLGDNVVRGGLLLLRGIEGSVEQGVDKSRLSESRFT